MGGPRRRPPLARPADQRSRLPRRAPAHVRDRAGAQGRLFPFGFCEPLVVLRPSPTSGTACHISSRARSGPGPARSVRYLRVRQRVLHRCRPAEPARRRRRLRRRAGPQVMRATSCCSRCSRSSSRSCSRSSRRTIRGSSCVRRPDVRGIRRRGLRARLADVTPSDLARTPPPRAATKKTAACDPPPPHKSPPPYFSAFLSPPPPPPLSPSPPPEIEPSRTPAGSLWAPVVLYMALIFALSSTSRPPDVSPLAR